MTALLIFSFFLLNLLSPGSSGKVGSSLKCRTCYSQTSWADCIRSSRVHNCPSYLDTCMTVHRNKTLHNGQIIHEFAKSCFIKKMCSRTYCEQRNLSQTRQVTCGVLKCSRKQAVNAVKSRGLNKKLRKLTKRSGIENE